MSAVCLQGTQQAPYLGGSSQFEEAWPVVTCGSISTAFCVAQAAAFKISHCETHSWRPTAMPCFQHCTSCGVTLGQHNHIQEYQQLVLPSVEVSCMSMAANQLMGHAARRVLQCACIS